MFQLFYQIKQYYYFLLLQLKYIFTKKGILIFNGILLHLILTQKFVLE